MFGGADTTVLITILSYLFWLGLCVYYFPAFYLRLDTAEQIFGSLLFISHLILILSWRLGGPITAAVLSFVSTFFVLYLCLVIKEPALFFQAILYGALYMGMLAFLVKRQRKENSKRLAKEKLVEDITIHEKEYEKKVALEIALEKRIHRFLDLHQFAELLKGIPGAAELSHRVVDEAHILIPGAQTCALYLLDQDSQQLSLIAAKLEKPLSSPDPRGSYYDQWVMKRARPLLVEDTRNDFRFSTMKRGVTAGVTSFCAAPLMTENRVLGVLSVSTLSDQAFTTDDLHTLDIIAGLAAVTLRNRLLFDRMEELAIRDGLTGLYVNRYFQERLAEEITRAHMHQGTFAIILLDIDFFKQVNDEYGHSAGDLVLKNIAAALLRNVSRGETAARYGGEEFVVLLPNTDKKAALRLAEKIRSDIQTSRYVLRRVEGAVTASLGVAVYPEDGITHDTLMGQADKNLYRAKNSGRNRVCGST